MDEKEKSYDIELSGDEKLIRVYDYLPYSYYRIVAILRDYYHAELNLTRGYKEGRYIPNYKQRYEVRDIVTKEVIKENVHLDDLRRVFAKNRIPVQEEPVPVHMRVRSQGAEQFNRILYQIERSKI